MKSTVKAAKERYSAEGRAWVEVPLKSGTLPGRRKRTNSAGASGRSK